MNSREEEHSVKNNFIYADFEQVILVFRPNSVHLVMVYVKILPQLFPKKSFYMWSLLNSSFVFQVFFKNNPPSQGWGHY